MNSPSPSRTDAGTSSHSPHSGGLKKVLGRWDALALGFGAMIGFGWVVLAGGWLTKAGALGAIAAILVGGAIMCLVGLTYAELSASMPFAGGEHNYLMRGMGAHWSLIGSWGITGGYVTIVAFEAVALPKSVAHLWPEINSFPLWEIAGSTVYGLWVVVGVAAAVLITIINIIGVKQASAVQVFVVIFLLLIGAMLLTGAFVGGDPANMTPLVVNGTSGFFAVMVAVPFLFVGFDVIPQSAEEVKIPARQIGKLVVIAVVLAVIWYVMVILTTASGLPHEQIVASTEAGGLVTAEAAAALWGGAWAGKLLVAGGIAGILTSWNALLIGAARLLYSLGKTGMIPFWFGKLNPRFGTPVNATLFIGALSMAAPFFGPKMLGWLVDSGAPSIIVAYILVGLTFVLLRRREPNMDRPLRVGGKGKGGVIIAIAAASLCSVLFLTYLPNMPSAIANEAWLLFGLWWAMGLVFLARLPRGTGIGEHAEERLHQAVLARAAARGTSAS